MSYKGNLLLIVQGKGDNIKNMQYKIKKILKIKRKTRLENHQYTDKQIEFCRLLAKGYSKVEAYRQGYKSDANDTCLYVKASKLYRQEAIEHLVMRFKYEKDK